VEVIEPTILDFNDGILSIEYESFSCVFDVNVGLDVDLSTEYESFSFNPIQTDLLFESCGSKFIESETIVTENFAWTRLYRILNLTDLWTLHPLFCLDQSFMMIYFQGQ